MNHETSFFPVHLQRGAALLTGLIFLVVLTLIGVAAARMASLEERMSGNMRDRSQAFQAAETGLRYVEQQIRTHYKNIEDFDPVCTNGLCYYGKNVVPTVVAWETYCTPECPIAYVPNTSFGAYEAPELPAGIPAPTYLIEAIAKNVAGEKAQQHYYRITVRARGARPGTVVWLQEIYKP